MQDSADADRRRNGGLPLWVRCQIRHPIPRVPRGRRLRRPPSLSIRSARASAIGHFPDSPVADTPLPPWCRHHGLPQIWSVTRLAMPVAIRVVAAEDSFLAREGIVSILGDIEDVELVEMSGDLDELRAAVARSAPHVVLTDIRMPPTNTDEGIRFAAELREQHPEMGVVVLSQHAEPRYALALFNAGSDRRAYLLKER